MPKLCLEVSKTISSAMLPLLKELKKVTSSITDFKFLPEVISVPSNTMLLLEVTEAPFGITDGMPMQELHLQVNKAISDARLPLEVIEVTFAVTDAISWDFDKELANMLPYNLPAACPPILPMCLPNSEEGS